MKRIASRTLVLAAALVSAMTLLSVRAELADDPLGDIARGNMAEIELSRMALDRASDPAVKQFAQMMIDDHTAAATELQTLAASKNITLPTAMDQKHQSALTKLGTRSGTDFDREYMKQMVDDHSKMVSMLQKQSDKGADADIKALAAKLLPTVQGHLNQARMISNTLTGGGRSSNANMSMSGNSNSNSRKNNNSNRKTNSNMGNGNSNGNSNRP